MNRRWIIPVLVSLIFTACIGCSTDTGSSFDTEKETVKVIYPTSRAMGNKDITGFETWFSENFPDAELEMISSAVATVTDTVKSEFKNNNAPDVFITTEYDAFIKEGYLADITGFPALTSFRRSSVRSLERDGKVYALPFGGGNLIALHYNKTLFDEYSIAYPAESETLYETVTRVNNVILRNNLDKRPIGASLMYPSQAAAVLNAAMSDITQTSDYINWITDYSEGTTAFTDSVFQKYIRTLESRIIRRSDEDESDNRGLMFGRDDYYSTQASAITSFLNGASFMYLGDVSRCYDTLGSEGIYDKNDIAVMGIPVGIENVSYVSYMDEFYIGINSSCSTWSDRKKKIINELLEYISSPEEKAANIFTFTSDYCSTYIEGQKIRRNDDHYFDEINHLIDHNYICQEVNNTLFSSILGRSVISMQNDELKSVAVTGNNNCDRITSILETYRTTGVNMFAKSDKPIGSSLYLMEYQSNIIRTQETAIGNQVADMARDYMNADFALINSGSIRSSIPCGDVSVQTINSVLPYDSYLVKIRISGASLKKTLENAYNVGPVYKSGQFGDISGLRVTLSTNPAGYSIFSSVLTDWENRNSEATEIQRNAEIKKIVEELCSEDKTSLNLQIDNITDSSGKNIEDDQYYTVALLDYLLKAGDGYDILGVLSKSAACDRSIEIMDRNGSVISGSIDQMTSQIHERCLKGADAFAEWVSEGNVMKAQIDGRISINNFIYIE